MNLSNLIPPQSVNSNTGREQTEQDYISNFSKAYSEQYNKFILKLFYKHFPWILSNTNPISILDLGCGWGPFAHSLAELITTAGGKPASQEIFEYIGVDIKQENIEFLQRAYKSFSAFDFHCHATKEPVDYIGKYIHSLPNTAETVSNSSGDECRYNFLNPNSISIQWSNSLITHLTPSAVDNLLATIYRALKPGGIAINCLLLADPLAIRAMNLNIADRKLPIDHGTYLTYSVQNPLACTAYKPEWLLAKYAANGLKIIDIQFGHWRGDGSRNEINNYIDIIIAQKTY